MIRPLYIPTRLLGAALLVATATAGDPPIVSSLSTASLHRSGRLLVFGADFGTQGPGARLEIDGIEAIATTWLPDEIHAYVPEGASFGLAAVRVVTPDGASDPVDLEVTARIPDGRVLWRFQVDSAHAGQDVGLGPTGELYVGDDERLYALAPDGELAWVLPEASSGGPIAVAADGTIYSYAYGVGVRAIDPAGQLIWTFVPPNPLQFVIAGPNLGPDGNLYLVQDSDVGGLGVFSLDPAGNLRWSDPGDPSVFDFGGAGTTEIEFTELAGDRLVFGNSGSLPGQAPLLYGFDLAGNQRWTSSSSCNTFPRVDPLGRVVFARKGSCGVTALDAGDASLVWNAPPPNNIVSTVRAAVGPDGTIYSGDFVGDLWALRPDGSTKWFEPAPFVVSKLGVSPDGGTIVEGQAALYGFDTADGSLRWDLELPVEEGFTQLVNTSNGPGFAPDGAATYVTTRFTGDGPGYSYLVAVALADGLGIGARYCGPANANSTGDAAEIHGLGSKVVAANDLLLAASRMPADRFGYFLASETQGFVANPGGSAGNLCLGGTIARYAKHVLQTGTSGTFALQVDLTAIPTQPPHAVVAGETWNFQAWFRDADPSPTSNFTDGLSVLFE